MVYSSGRFDMNDPVGLKIFTFI